MKVIKANHNPLLLYVGINIYKQIKYIIKLMITELRIILDKLAPIKTPSKWKERKETKGDKAIQSIYLLVSFITSSIGEIKGIKYAPYNNNIIDIIVALKKDIIPVISITLIKLYFLLFL